MAFVPNAKAIVVTPITAAAIMVACLVTIFKNSSISVNFGRDFTSPVVCWQLALDDIVKAL